MFLATATDLALSRSSLCRALQKEIHVAALKHTIEPLGCITALRTFGGNGVMLMFAEAKSFSSGELVGRLFLRLLWGRCLDIVLVKIQSGIQFGLFEHCAI